MHLCKNRPLTLMQEPAPDTVENALKKGLEKGL